MRNILEDFNFEYRVSIIMPVYNAALYVDKSIQHILNQSYTDFELVVIDDGSTDNSGAILDAYGKIDSRIKVIHTKNRGVSKARNLGINIASGKWLLFVDSDDTIEINALEILIREAEQFNSDMTIVGYFRENIISGEKNIHKPKRAELNNYKEITKYFREINLDSSTLVLNYLWNRLFRLSVIKENHIYFDETLNLGEDFVFITSVIKVCRRILVLPEAFYHYCYHGENSLVGEFHENEFNRRKIMFDSLCSLYDSFGILQECKQQLQIREGKYLLNSLCKIKYKSCNLNKERKIKYIQEYLNSRSISYMIFFLKTQRGLKNRVKELLLKIGNANLLYIVLNYISYTR